VLIGREDISTFIRLESFEFCRILCWSAEKILTHLFDAKASNSAEYCFRTPDYESYLSTVGLLGVMTSFCLSTESWRHTNDVQAFLTLAPGKSEWSDPSSGRLTPMERTSSIHRIGGWVDPTTSLLVFIYRESNSGQSLHGLHNTLSYIQTNKLKFDVTVNMKVIFDIVHRLEFF
jgi:hypothetical protein